MAGEEGGQVAHRIVVGLPEIDRDAEHRNDMVLVGEVLEVAGDGRALRDERTELLRHDGRQEVDRCREDRGDDAVEREEGTEPGNAPPLSCVDRRIQHHRQDPCEDKGPQDASDGERQDQGQDAQDTKKDKGAEVSAPPQLIHPASLHHRGIIHC